MKAYTDIEQSRKLAKILPLESADMAYWKRSRLPNDYAITAHHSKELQEGFEAKCIEYIPCWSLASLLSILPDRTCVYKKTYKDERVKYQGIAEGIKELILKDNPVDACYELVLKLHELKML